MADPYQYLTDSGVIVPDTDAVLADVQQEYRDALGQNLITTPNTPQGALIAAETTARQNVIRNNAALANQINPDVAGGVFLDALWRLTGGQRTPARASTIPGVALTGVPGTLVPAGSAALTSNGDRFLSVADATLGAAGTALVDFVAESPGPVPAPVGALSSVETAVLGWETVSNPTAAVLGQDRETDAAARLRRRSTLAAQGVALPEAIVSALYNVPGVQSVVFRENVKSTAQVIDGVNLAPNSVYAVVNGGTSADIAAALLGTKSMGANWNGATTVNVTDATTGQVYAVQFDRPAAVPLLVRVTVKGGAVADPVGVVQNAILTYANGLLDGERGFVVGGAVSPFELAGAVNRQAPGMYVPKVEIALASTGVYQTSELPVTIQQIATIAQASILVVVL